MSSSDPALSFEEAMERELSRFKNVIVEKEKMEMEMERVKGERDSLKKEVEELKLKMMESHQTSLLNKSILQELEQTVLKANAALAALAVVPPRTGLPRVGFSSKGSSTVDVGTEDAKKSVFAQTKQYNQLLNLEAGGRSTADRFRPKEAYNFGTVVGKQVDRGETPEASRGEARRVVV